MNIKEDLTCQYCNQIFKHPIMLNCCGENICKNHVDEMVSNKFLCPLCKEENTNQIFKANKIIEKLIKRELHAFELDPKYETVLSSLRIEIEKIAAILKDPENYIDEEISELKRQVDLDRERLKIRIDELANDLIQQLESYERKFKSEYKAKVNLEHYTALVESSRKQLVEFENFFELFSTKNQEREEKYKDCERLVKVVQPSLIEIQNKLFSDLSLTYQLMEHKIEDLFGKLEIKETKKVEFFGALRQKLTGHSGPVYALAKLNNGDLISGSSDNTIKIWNVSDWTVKQTLNSHAEWLFDIIVLDENKIINASNENAINIWDLNDVSLKNTLTGHTSRIRALVVLKNGDLASGSNDKTIKIWNMKNGNLKKTLKGHTLSVLSLVVLNKEELASGSTDNTIKIWDADSGIVKRTLKGHTGAVFRLNVLSNGDLVSVSNDNTIKIWNIEDGSVKRTLTGHTSYVYAVKVLDNGCLASGSWDCTVKIWNIEDGTILKDITLNSEVYSLEVLQNSDLVVGSIDGSIQIFN